MILDISAKSLKSDSRAHERGKIRTGVAQAADSLQGSDAEHKLQRRYGRTTSAHKFYRHQMLDYLNPLMCEFIARQEMMFVGTADQCGHADASFRGGAPGFVRVIDEKTLAYPEYRGNGVMASLGNISDNPHVGLLFLDFTGDKIGLHVNGQARIVENGELLASASAPRAICDDIIMANGRRPERWVMVAVVEAYVHCSKHIPRMRKLESLQSEPDGGAKAGDYFKAKASPRTDSSLV
ncbi:MAG: pyridoxamine 5'-phosphate oxidase family protein [Candidatus Binataceae bacterium]